MTREWIMQHYEQDWDDENIYFTVTEQGRIIKYDLSTNQTIEYEMERVER